MDKGSKVYLDAMLSLTSNKEWDVFVEDLKKEIYNHQANVLETTKSWDEVVYLKGWTSCLAYITSLRHRTKIEIENSHADV